jgi:hypothetical protein
MAAVNARIVTLKAKAKSSADLAFDETGSIANAEPAVEIGAQVAAYAPRTALYSQLGTLELVGDKPTGRLVFDSKALRKELQSKAIVILDNESHGADLDQAILARQNDWLTLYSHVADISLEASKRYGDRLASLKRLLELADEHHKAIDDAYVEEQKWDNPIDDPKHNPTIRPTTINTIKMAGVASIERGLSTDYGAGTPVLSHGVNQFTAVGKLKTGGNPNSQDDWEVQTQLEPTVVAQRITSIVQSDGITFPQKENDIRRERLVADLSDEFLTDYVFFKRVPSLEMIWKNELDSIDLEIKKLQLAYIATFIFSPFDGKVTAFYKQAGENVRAGDPVVRVENENALLLVGQVVCPSAPSVGQPVKIVTQHVFGDSGSPPVILNGKVVVVKGVDTLCGRWNVTFDVGNSGAVRIPAGYDFDPDPGVTTVAIG